MFIINGIVKFIFNYIVLFLIGAVIGGQDFLHWVEAHQEVTTLLTLFLLAGSIAEAKKKSEGGK